VGRSPFKTQMGKWCDEHTCRDRASHKMDVAKSDTMSGGCGLNGKRAIYRVAYPRPAERSTASDLPRSSETLP